MFLGVFISKIDKQYQSDPKVLSIDQYPLKQKILFNQEMVDMDGSDLTT